VKKKFDNTEYLTMILFI